MYFNRNHFIIRMKWLPTPDESLARFLANDLHNSAFGLNYEKF